MEELKVYLEEVIDGMIGYGDWYGGQMAAYERTLDKVKSLLKDDDTIIEIEVIEFSGLAELTFYPNDIKSGKYKLTKIGWYGNLIYYFIRLGLDADALSYASLVRLGRNKKKLKALNELIKGLKSDGILAKMKTLYLGH